MLKAFEKIRRFGVFDHYSRPADIEDFAELNLIYGWNYAGKTTLSRVFRSVEKQALHPDYGSAEFEISTHNNSPVTVNSLATHSLKVRVFNSDFVKDNLSWDGEAFNPILLLGQQSIQAQQEIVKNDALLIRLREGYRRKAATIRRRDEALREKKTEQAKGIKQTLQLVEAFTATHLNQDLSTVGSNPAEHLQTDGEVVDLLQAATADERGILPKIDRLEGRMSVVDPTDGIYELLAQKPSMANTIKYLAEHAQVADWVRTGLALHNNKDKCEFCGNQLESKRMECLRAHFSKDIEVLEALLRKKQIELLNLRLRAPDLHKSDFYPQLRSDLEAYQSNLWRSIKSYNDYLDILSALVDEKLSAPFNQVECPRYDEELGEDVRRASVLFDLLIQKNNEITATFGETKRQASAKLKLHYAAKFFIAERLDLYQQTSLLLEKQKSWYEQAGNRLSARNKVLHAQISQAQKGREELNDFIAKFLVGSNVAVAVTTVDGAERFQLMRNDVPAKNLSEGERTAIAYAFFLIKLKEDTDMSDLIVYVDDPISSLDSNHIFQINAVTKEFFFWYDSAEKKTKLTVKQLFISTHNFEFLSLAKELPIQKKNRRSFYFVKRVCPGRSTFIAMPPSIMRYNSEYQYLWHVIYDFHQATDKTDLEKLLALPNAMRRFVELYTYAKFPADESVDKRASVVFGAETSKRVMKLLHYFSHANNLMRISQNNEFLCDIENVVNELVDLVQADRQHYDALMSALA
jgi:wobble nucleotide-excising tRNase